MSTGRGASDWGIEGLGPGLEVESLEFNGCQD